MHDSAVLLCSKSTQAVHQHFIRRLLHPASSIKSNESQESGNLACSKPIPTYLSHYQLLKLSSQTGRVIETISLALLHSNALLLHHLKIYSTFNSQVKEHCSIVCTTKYGSAQSLLTGVIQVRLQTQNVITLHILLCDSGSKFT